jgi:UPF0716 protein FxsA
MYLFLAFLLVPMIEIALFIQVGGLIGLWPTLAIVVVTAVLGAGLVRSQGLAALARVKTSFTDLRDPSQALADGAMILFAGALLLTPGFFTDTVGFLLLIPPVRAAIFAWARARVQVHHFDMAPPRGPARDDIIDGDWEEVRDPRPNRRPSKWSEDRLPKD